MEDSENLKKDETSKIQSIEVEIVYAAPEEQVLLNLIVKQGTTALAAVLASELDTKFPKLNVNEAKMGIFSKLLDGKHLPLPDKYILAHKDRVEIYRPLLIDPKQSRMQRVKEERKNKRKEKALLKKNITE